MSIKRVALFLTSFFLSIDCFGFISNWQSRRKEKVFEKYENCTINNDNQIFTFSCTYAYSKTICNHNNRAIKSVESKIAITAESYTSIGITTFEITEIESESVLAEVNVYTYVNKDGRQDGIIECCGATTTISQALVADIALTIANYTQAESLASEFIDIPVFNVADPTVYLFCLAKLEIIKNHFSQNYSLLNDFNIGEETLINNQNDPKWKNQ